MGLLRCVARLYDLVLSVRDMGALTLHAVVEAYLVDCRSPSRGLAAKTVAEYGRFLHFFGAFEWSGDLLIPPTGRYGSLLISDLTTPHITGFFQDLDAYRSRVSRDNNDRRNREVSKTTRADYAMYLRVFFGWVNRYFAEHGVPYKPPDVPRIRCPRREIPSIPPEARDAILAYADAQRKQTREFKDHRNFILCQLLTLGLRKAELLDLKPGDFVLGREMPYVLIRHGKGGHERTVPLRLSMVTDLNFYLLRLRDLGYEYLAASTRRPRKARATARRFWRLNETTVNHIIARLAIRAGVNPKEIHVNCSRWRHDTATTALEFGANLGSVQALLGHRDIRTTQRYLDSVRLNASAAVEAIEKAHECGGKPA